MADHTEKQGSGRFKRFGEVIAELKKVVWLPKREVGYLTGIVLVVTAAAAAFLGFVDFGFAEAVNKLLLGG